MKITLGFAQSDAAKSLNKKWTIGTILINEPVGFYERGFAPNYFNGIVFKKHFTHFTTRIGIEFVKLLDEKDKPNPASADQLYSEGYVKEGLIRIGIEKGFIIKEIFKPYFAIDLTGIKSYSDKTQSGGITGYTERIIKKTSGIGAIPAIGFEFKITKYLALAVEARARLIFTKSTSDIEYLLYSEPTYHRKTQNFEEPLSQNLLLALNINF